MEKKKLTRKERKFNDEVENKKNYIGLNNMRVYADSDIPLRNTSYKLQGGMIPPHLVWMNFEPDEEEFDSELIAETEDSKTYKFCALHCLDDDLIVQMTVYFPAFESKKAVLMIPERTRLPRKCIIDTLLHQGFYVILVDYNGLTENTQTSFPKKYAYGKVYREGSHLDTPAPTVRESCPFLYTLMHRRALAFFDTILPERDVIVLGVRSGVEIAMQLAGLEQKRITALGCICGAGYNEYLDIPKYDKKQGATFFDNQKMAFIIGASGVSYLKNYPHPVFVALGSNGTNSDVDRLLSLKELIDGHLTIKITQSFMDNIDENAWEICLKWLNMSFWKSDFPTPPISQAEVNRDGTVYANITADISPKIKEVNIYYSYNNTDHKTRRWKKVHCETIGEGQYLAKIDIKEDCSYLFLYAETQYINGLVATEAPHMTSLKGKRITLALQKPTTVLFTHGIEGEFIPISENAIVNNGQIYERTVPAGAKGTACKNGSMRLFVGDICRSISPVKLLQADAFLPVGDMLELSVRTENPTIDYKARKYVHPGGNFDNTRFALSDFKNEYFQALDSWEKVSSISVLTPDATINKLIFV